MTEVEFNQWRSDLFSLDRYESSEDSIAFVKLVQSVCDQLDKCVIDTLLATFCDKDDYGVQEVVLGVLDNADPVLFAERLEANFAKIVRHSSEQEWPLILIGNIVNSGDNQRILPLINTAKNKQGDLYQYIVSEECMDEYPEIENYFSV